MKRAGLELQEAEKVLEVLRLAELWMKHLEAGRHVVAESCVDDLRGAVDALVEWRADHRLPTFDELHDDASQALSEGVQLTGKMWRLRVPRFARAVPKRKPPKPVKLTLVKGGG